MCERSPAAQEVFDACDDALGFSLSELCWQGPPERLAQIEYAHPAILAHSLAAWAAVRQEHPKRISVAIGHSLGEWSALVAAGALELAEAVRLVHRRGQLVQQTVPAGTGAMAAIAGMPPDAVTAACADAALDEIVSLAADIDMANQVIAGHAPAVHRACHLCLQRGALRAELLPVSAPLHCEFMAPAAEQLRALLRDVQFQRPACAWWSTVADAALADPADIGEVLVRQMTATVRWRGAIAALAGMGATHAMAVGPAAAVPGMVKRTARGLKVRVVAEAADLAGLQEASDA